MASRCSRGRAVNAPSGRSWDGRVGWASRAGRVWRWVLSFWCTPRGSSVQSALSGRGGQRQRSNRHCKLLLVSRQYTTSAARHEAISNSESRDQCPVPPLNAHAPTRQRLDDSHPRLCSSTPAILPSCDVAGRPMPILEYRHLSQLSHRFSGNACWLAPHFPS